MELTKTPVTMSTNEIAALTGKRHDHVIRDTEKMLIDLEIDLPNFEGIYCDTYGRKAKCYNLDRRLTNILITGYSIKLRAAVIDRLDDIEKQIASPVLTIDMMISAYQEQKAIVESQKPAVEFASQMSANKGSIKVGDFAKILFDKNNLVIGQNRLFKWFRINKYLQSDNKPFQRFVDQGLFQVVSGVIDGTTRIWSTTKITGKGIVYFTSKLIKSEDFKPVNKLQIEVR